MLTHLASNYLNAGIEGQRWGTGHQSIVPYQVVTGHTHTLYVPYQVVTALTHTLYVQYVYSISPKPFYVFVLGTIFV